VDWPADLQRRLAQFARERDWEKYHTPRNRAALIASETGELLALFRWDQDALTKRLDEVEAELADVLLGVLRFADVAGIDLRAAALRKLEANAWRCPARRELGPDPARNTPPVGAVFVRAIHTILATAVASLSQMPRVTIIADGDDL